MCNVHRVLCTPSETILSIYASPCSEHGWEKYQPLCQHHPLCLVVQSLNPLKATRIPCACSGNSSRDVRMYLTPYPYTLCRLTHKPHICSGQIRTGEAAGCRPLLVMEKAKEGVQTASALASFPTHRAPVTAQREERPPSRTQGTFLFAWLPLHNLSEKSTVSPFSLPRGSFWQSMKYCV